MYRLNCLLSLFFCVRSIFFPPESEFSGSICHAFFQVVGVSDWILIWGIILILIFVWIKFLRAFTKEISILLEIFFLLFAAIQKVLINQEIFVWFSIILGDLEGPLTIDDSFGCFILLFQRLFLVIKLITFLKAATHFWDRMILNWDGEVFLKALMFNFLVYKRVTSS